jgi:low affinity Fe/Cu permease
MIVWLATGPLFGFSDAWQLIVNTITNVVAFLMVFLVQNTQNRDGAALQTKLDELIRASGAQNAYIGIEHLTDDEIDEIPNARRAPGRRPPARVRQYACAQDAAAGVCRDRACLALA